MTQLLMLSKREKILAGVAGLILVGMVTVGYAQTSLGTASTLVAQDSTQTQDDTGNQQRWLKDQQNWLKNSQREVTDIKKQAKKLDTTAVDALLGQLSTQLQTYQALVGTQDFWSNTQDFNSLQRDFDELMNESLRPARDCEQWNKNVNDRRKEKKSNLDNQPKDILRNDKTADISRLTEIFAKIDAQFTIADQAYAQTCTRDSASTLNDARMELDSLFRDAYDTANELRQNAEQIGQLSNSIKDFEKDKKKRCTGDKASQLKSFEKDVARASKSGVDSASVQETLAKVKDIYNQMCVVKLGEMQKALENKDPTTYNDASSEFNNLERDFWDTMNESRQGVNEQIQKVEHLKNITRDLKRWTSELKRMNLDLKRTIKTYEKTAKKHAGRDDVKEQVVAFAADVAQLVDVKKNIEEKLALAKEKAPKDPESWWMDHQDELNDLQTQYSEIQQKVQTVSQLMQFLKDVEKQLKGSTREMAQLKRESNNDPELMKSLQGILDSANADVKNIWANVVTDPEGAMDSLESMKSMGEEWNDTVNTWRESKQEDNWKE